MRQYYFSQRHRVGSAGVLKGYNKLSGRTVTSIENTTLMYSPWTCNSYRPVQATYTEKLFCGIIAMVRVWYDMRSLRENYRMTMRSIKYLWERIRWIGSTFRAVLFLLPWYWVQSSCSNNAYVLFKSHCLRLPFNSFEARETKKRLGKKRWRQTTESPPPNFNVASLEFCEV